MKFDNKETIEENLSWEEESKAAMKIIRHSDAWKKHTETHKNAELSISETQPKQENTPVKYEKHNEVWAQCGCGMGFKLDAEDGKVETVRLQDKYSEERGTYNEKKDIYSEKNDNIYKNKS